MKKSLLLGLPLVLMAPLMLLMLGMGSANIEAVRAACATTTGAGSGSFGIGTLNWRGASHYTKNPHPGERPYGERVPNMVSKIGASGASIIGFQEFEPPQAQAFLDATDGDAVRLVIVDGREVSPSWYTRMLVAHGFVTVLGTLAIAVAALWPVPSRRGADVAVSAA